MTTRRGWWKLTFIGVDELNENDLERIAEQIKEGFNQGEVVQEREELLLCQDCTSAAVNDDYTGLDYHYSPEQAEKVMADIKVGLMELGPGLTWDSNKPDVEFSRKPCDCCKSRLAGLRVHFTII